MIFDNYSSFKIHPRNPFLLLASTHNLAKDDHPEIMIVRFPSICINLKCQKSLKEWCCSFFGCIKLVPVVILCLTFGVLVIKSIDNINENEEGETRGLSIALICVGSIKFVVILFLLMLILRDKCSSKPQCACFGLKDEVKNRFSF